MSDVELAEVVGYLVDRIEALEKRVALAEVNTKNVGIVADNSISRCDFIEENISTVLDYAMYWQQNKDKT